MNHRLPFGVALVAALAVIPLLIVQAQEATTADAIIEDTVAATPEPATPDTQELATESASSSDAIDERATSTPPIEEPNPPKEEPFVLQPAVELTIRDGAVSADITFENLTCKECDRALPELDVITYYTGWYPNDGEIGDIAGRTAVEAEKAPTVANWGKHRMHWSAADIPKGRYYFVVVVDPENTHGAYRMHRSEFSI
ncbi:MAG: hypothetical protein AB7F99_00655 [Vicinamibacterales bacterium]